MKNTFVKVLSFMMALTMIVGAFGAITVSAAACTHENRTETAVVAPTCGTAGFTRYECNDCGKEFIDSIKSATGKHSWKDVAETKATCEENGYAAHKVCTVCGVTDPEEPKVVEYAKDHVWNIPYKQAATCTEDGFTSKKCAVCDKVDDRVAPEDEDPSDEFGWKVVSATDKAAHKYIYTVVTAPTACTNGTVKVTCSACDYSENIIQKEDHNWVDMTTTTDVKAGSTCQYEWNKGKFCADCKTVHPDAVKNTTTTHTMVEVDFATIDEGNLTAEIQALGYNYGDKTSTDVATQCVTVRVYLAKCSICNTYDKVSKVLDEGKGHKWVKDGAAYYADGTPSHKEDKLQNYKCDNVLEDGTTKCSATKTEIDTKATACTYKKEGAIDVHAATCETNGYTEYKCDECGAVTKGDITFKTGHNYGAAVYKSGTCDTADDTDDGADDPDKIKYVQKCPNKGCETPEKDAELPKDADKCTWVKVTRKATCIADAYYENECSVCKATKAYTATSATDKPAAGKDTNNHVAKFVDGAATGILTTVGLDADEDGVIDVPGLLEANIVKQTCTTSRVDKYMCLCGKDVKLTVGAAPAHDYGESYTDDKGNVISVAVKPATCKAEGIKTAGEICEVCGTINPAKKPEVDPINPKNHDVEGVFVANGEANCVSRKYTTSYYSCCGLVDKIESGDIDPTVHSDLQSVAAVAATCTTTGTKAHQKCNGCGKIYVDGVEKTATDLVTYRADDDKDLKHKWKAEAEAKVEETCTTDGTKAYFKCEHCTVAVKIGDDIVEEVASTTASEIDAALKIAKHGTEHTGRYAYLYNENVVPTCTEGAWGEIPNTPMCKKCVLDADKANAEKNGTNGTYWLVKLNHKNTSKHYENATTSANYDCTKPSYTVVTCKDCTDYTVVEGYVKAAKTAHDYDRNNDNKVDDKDIYITVDPTCTTAGEYVYWCENANCKANYTTAGKPATGHYLATAGGDVPLNFSCKDDAWKAFAGLTCSAPGCGLTVSADGANAEHNIVTAEYKAPTCTATGNFEFDYCVDCGKIFAAPGVDVTKLEIPAKGHNVDSDLIEVVDGVAKYSCPDCGEFWTESVIDNVSVEAEFSSTLVTAGSTFTVEIFATADNFAFNEFEIDCSAWDVAFELVKVELTDALPATAHADFDSDGYFWIYSEHNAEGKPGFITLNGEKINIATLTFKVADVAEPNEFTFEVGPYDAVVGFDEDGYPIESEIIADYVEYDVTVALAGDLNGDYMIGTSDVQKVMYIVSTGANDLVADVNRDGAVDVFDIAALRKFTSSDNTAYDFFVMTGVDVEAVAAKYKADMNEDGYINDSDKVLFVEFIVDLLQDEYYLDFIVEMAYDDFADLDEFCADKAIDIAINGVPTI